MRTGVEVVKGTVADCDALSENTVDVDKFVCCVGLEDGEAVYFGTALLVRALRDAPGDD